MKRNAFGVVIAFTLMSNLANNLVHPVTPTLITERMLPDYSFGVLFAAMSVGMLLSSPLWGRFSDRHGRVKSIFLGNIGYAVGQLIFLFGYNLPVLVFARFLSGFLCSGSIVSMMACVVDLSDADNRAMRLSTYAACVCVASSMGYFVGGMLGTLSVAHAFLCQSALLFAIGVAALFWMPETRETGVRRAERAQTPKLTLKGALGIMTPALAVYLLCVVFANLGTSGYDNAFNYFIKRELNFPSSYNGVIKALNGLLGLAATLGVNRMILRRFSSDEALPALLGLCAVMLLVATGMTDTAPFIGFNIAFYLFNAMYQPLQQSLLVRAADCDFGLLSGIFNSAKSLGMIIGSLAAGALYTVAPRAPFYMQAASFALAAALCLAFCRMTRHRAFVR